MPQRIQRQRSKGWMMPEGAVYVGRPTKWGNPFVVGAPHPLTGEVMTADTCVDLFRRGILAACHTWTGGDANLFSTANEALYDAWEAVAPHLAAVAIQIALDDLRGRDLACWCKPGEPCHADVLLELANIDNNARLLAGATR